MQHLEPPTQRCVEYHNAPAWITGPCTTPAMHLSLANSANSAMGRVIPTYVTYARYAYCYMWHYNYIIIVAVFYAAVP